MQKNTIPLLNYLIFEEYLLIFKLITKTKNSKVSVLMPVFDSEPFIRAAIDSILAQTYTNFEFIIINDGSKDGSDAIIRSYNDERIKYIDHKNNKGIVATLNEGLAISSGDYIARMDADDISLPKRLEKQVAFLEKNPEYKLCGSNAIAINFEGNKLYKLNRPKAFERIKVFNLFRNAFIHPSIMADATTIKKFGYQEDYKYAEDYLLFSQFTMNHKVANLDDRLLNYRLHDSSITSIKNNEMVKSELKTIRFLLSFLFETVNEKLVLLHHSILRPQQSFTAEETHNHLINLLKKNNEKHLFSHELLRKQLLKEWYRFLLTSKGNKPLTSYVSSPLFILLRDFNPKYMLKLLLK